MVGIIEAIYYLTEGKCDSIISAKNNTYTKDMLSPIWNGKNYASFTKGNMTEEEYKSKLWRVNQ